MQNYLKNKDFINSIKSSKYTELNISHLNNDSIINLQIYLIDSIPTNYLELGALIYNKIDPLNINNLTFIFSDNLIFIKKDVCADIIYGFLSKSFKFDKYLDKKNKQIKTTLNLYNVKPFKILNYKKTKTNKINNKITILTMNLHYLRVF